MSIVIGIKNEKFSMLAADTRICLANPIGKIEDSYAKLFDVNCGWVSGTGFNVVINSFVNHILDNNINNLDDMRDIYKNICSALESEYKKNDIEKTILALAYSHKENNVVKLEIETMSRNPMVVGGLNDNGLFVLPPLGISESECEELQSKYAPLIEGNYDLNELIYHTADYIENVSRMTSSVSDICEFGFMFNVDNVLATRKHLRKKAKDIKEICLEGNIEMHLQERNPIIWNLGIQE